MKNKVSRAGRVRGSLVPLLCFLTVCVWASADLPIKDQVLKDQSAAVRGETTFNGTCTFCHGHEGQGGQGRPLQGRQFDADKLFTVISKGRTRGGKRMPPYANTFSETQRWELVAYLLALNTK